MSKADDGNLGAFESLVENARNKTVDVKKFTRQIWLAGLGAYAKDNDDGYAFKQLVVEGKNFEKRAKDKRANQTVKHKKIAESGSTWQKLESAFDERLSGALCRLGICTHSDIERLNLELDHLTKTIEQLNESVDNQDN